MAFLSIDNLHKTFGAHVALHHFDMQIERGEFVTFLGPSGCGKTTVLRMIAGFETPTRGAIHMDGRDVTRTPTRDRNVGMVFQSYALFPNMTVADNIGFGLRVNRTTPTEIRRRVGEMLELIKLPHIAERYPWQLSGGQQQRVALARALAGQPQVLLLDEPLSALDAKIRISLRQDIRTLQRKLGITSIFVTHDQEEALSMSDRIVVMNDGRVEQVGGPGDIYNFPRTQFVASFVGTLNILSGRVVDPAIGRMAVGNQELVTSRSLPASDAGKARLVAVRPEAIVLEPPTPGRNTLGAVVEDVDFHGAVVRIRTRVQDAVVSLDVFNDPARKLPERGQQVSLGFSYDNLVVLEEAAA
ncbi:Fe3+/spermidine/putrescine ABC transporter ATP-binding protein [Burkholderia pyrrocinia]|uniref:ABC transporter ATP-binding protein n=1 Tax=Burkholderia stagnalis TaxID=1503054 RepID=UPI0002E89A2D|nr:ABC transporter ATP-binding protein [Burkholderia stagnalis]KVN41494.1 Fe3+/spermidine/putrescine ABC transporter ATP-binding protein [Burkholderia pyrrocinia]WGS46502.1 ABC transporter ATP-binding protein [Burkholderia sp. JSH-S8]